MEAEVPVRLLLRCSGRTGSACWPPRMPVVSWSCSSRPSPGGTVPRLRRGGAAKDRRPVWVRDLPIGGKIGRGVLAQTSLVLPACVVLQEDLDRAASCDRTPRVPDRPCSGVGVRPGRRPGRRRVAGRVRARCRLGDDHADRHHSRRADHRRPRTAGRADRDRGGRGRVLRATGRHPTRYATGIADLTPGRPARLVDVVAGRSGVVLAGWLHERDHAWRAQIATASLDPFRGYATALNQQLPRADRVPTRSMSRSSG